MPEFRSISSVRLMDGEGEWWLNLQIEYGDREIVAERIPLDDMDEPVDVAEVARHLVSLAGDFAASDTVEENVPLVPEGDQSASPERQRAWERIIELINELGVPTEVLEGIAFDRAVLVKYEAAAELIGNLGLLGVKGEALGNIAKALPPPDVKHPPEAGSAIEFLGVLTRHPSLAYSEFGQENEWNVILGFRVHPHLQA